MDIQIHKYITPWQVAEIDSDFCLEIKSGKPTNVMYRQVQSQMALCGMKYCDYAVYTFKGMHIEINRYDDTHWSELLSKLEKFYFEHFLSKIWKFFTLFIALSLYVFFHSRFVVCGKI